MTSTNRFIQIKKKGSLDASLVIGSPVSLSAPTLHHLHLQSAIHPELDFDALKSEFEIIHLLFYRNKNQHRGASWWSSLSLLHRHLHHLVQRLSQIVAGKNEREIENDKQWMTNTCTHMMRKLIPKAYRWFHSLIAQGQFVALGIALVALVSKVYHTLRPLCRVNYISSSLDVMMKEVEGAALGSNDENGYDLGMVISRDQTITAPKMTADKVTTTMKSEVGQEKKKFRTTITSTSIIEDIFAVPSGTKNKSKSVVNDIFSNDSRKQKSSKSGSSSTGDKKKKKKRTNAIDDIFGI